MGKFLTDVDLNQNELQYAVIQNLNTDPIVSTTGQIYYNTNISKLRLKTAAGWITIATGTITIPSLQDVVNAGNGISNFGGIGNASIQSTNFTNNRTLYLNDDTYSTIRIVDNLNASNNLQIDLDTLTLDGVSYNWSTIVNPPASPLSALPFTTDHLAATNNQYVIGDLVWYLGNVYRCIANNDSIIPTSTLYWTSLGIGYPLVQQPADWNSTSGNNQILNKPVITIPNLQQVTDGVGNNITTNEITAAKLIKDGGQPQQFLKADGSVDNNTYVTTANLTLQNAYNNSTDATIILDATRGNIKVKSIAGITKSMSFFDPLGNEVLTFHSESGGPNIKRISANNNGFFVDSGSNIRGGNLSIIDIYSTGDIVLSNNKTLTSYLNPAVNHYFKGISGVKWESNVKIEYAADYSALYSNRSLIDKGYADSTYLISAVTSVGATSPITSSGGATPVISTSMDTNKLIGRSTAGTGVMEEITVGTGLSLSAGILTNTATYTSPLTTKGDIFVRSTVDTRLPVGIDGQILTANSGAAEGLSWQDNYADWTSTVKHIVKNNGLSGTITKGTAVYVTSSDGTNMLVGRASNTSEATSSKTMGLMQSDITTAGGTQTGFVITEGLLAGLNTAGTTAGDPVWLGVNGALIYGLVNKPYAPNHLVFIGIVTKVSAGNGEIFVKVQNGFELKELHDVQAQNPSLNDILWYDNSVSPAQWKTASIATILGYTPPNLGLVQAMTQGLQNIF